jgi:hypothetical protein
VAKHPPKQNDPAAKHPLKQVSTSKAAKHPLDCNSSSSQSDGRQNKLWQVQKAHLPLNQRPLLPSRDSTTPRIPRRIRASKTMSQRREPHQWYHRCPTHGLGFH